MKQGQKVQGKQGRKSLKGTRGNTVGAPPKSFRMPNGKFSIAGLISLNVGSCGLTCRNKLSELVINPAKGTGNPNGTVYQLQSRKQSGGKVGRPEAMFVTKENYDKTKMVLFQDTPVEVKAPKTPRVKKVKKTSADVTPSPAPVIPAPASPAAVVETSSTTPIVETVPVAEVAPVVVTETAPVVSPVETTFPVIA